MRNRLPPDAFRSKNTKTFHAPHYAHAYIIHQKSVSKRWKKSFFLVSFPTTSKGECVCAASSSREKLREVGVLLFDVKKSREKARENGHEYAYASFSSLTFPTRCRKNVRVNVFCKIKSEIRKGEVRAWNPKGSFVFRTGQFECMTCLCDQKIKLFTVFMRHIFIYDIFIFTLKKWVIYNVFSSYQRNAILNSCTKFQNGFLTAVFFTNFFPYYIYFYIIFR